MKVDNLSSKMQGIEQAQNRKVDQKLEDNKANANQTAEQLIGDSAKVDLSSQAQAYQKAKSIAGSTDTVDNEKVARLQSLIDQGKYKVDAEAIADRLVDEHLKMHN